MPTLAIIHTTPATIDTLKALAAELLPGYDVVNIVDDSVLPQLIRNGGDVSEVQGRLVQYARNAAEVGADVILEACSSVGEVVAQMRAAVDVPVVRIDEAMAEEAVRRGTRIGVAATLPTTLNPTVRLLQAKSAEAGKRLDIQTALAESAYRKLMAGDRDGHDADLLEVLTALAEDVDVVVLAQASMARVLARMPEAQQRKFLSSPRLGMERVRDVVGES